jgi:hypothetical protein
MGAPDLLTLRLRRKSEKMPQARIKGERRQSNPLSGGGGLVRWALLGCAATSYDSHISHKLYNTIYNI